MQDQRGVRMAAAHPRGIGTASLHTALQSPCGIAWTPVLPCSSQDCLSCLEKPVLPQHSAEPCGPSLAGPCGQVVHTAAGVRTELNEDVIRENVFREVGQKWFFVGYPSLPPSAFILKVVR